MKTLRYIIAILILSMIAYGMTSCMVRTYDDGGGRHRGRVHENRNNDHDNGGVIIIKKEHRERRSDDDHGH